MSDIVKYENRTFICNGKLTIYKASECKHAFSQLLSRENDKSGTFYLELSGVEVIDASIFQILVSLKKTIESHKGKLELKKDSPALESILGILGFQASFFAKAA